MESLRRFGGRLWQWEASVDNKSTIASVSIFLLTNRLWHKQLKCSSLPQKKFFFLLGIFLPTNRQMAGEREVWEFNFFSFFFLVYYIGWARILLVSNPSNFGLGKNLPGSPYLITDQIKSVNFKLDWIGNTTGSISRMLYL